MAAQFAALNVNASGASATVVPNHLLQTAAPVAAATSPSGASSSGKSASGANTSASSTSSATHLSAPSEVSQATAISDRPKAKPVSKKDGKNQRNKVAPAQQQQQQQQNTAANTASIINKILQPQAQQPQQQQQVCVPIQSYEYRQFECSN